MDKKYGLIINNVVRSSFFRDDSVSIENIQLEMPDISAFIEEIDPSVMDNFVKQGDGSFLSPRDLPSEEEESSEEGLRLENLISKLQEKGVLTKEDADAIIFANADATP